MPTVKISALTELTAPTLSDFLPIVDVSDTTQAATGTTKYIKISPLIAQLLQMPGRLSLSNTLAVPTSDLTAQTTLYYVLTGSNGNLLPLYSSSSWKAFTISSPLSLSLVGLTASSVYDIFCYDSSGTPTLEALIWSSSGAGTSARATELTTQDGRYVKDGDPTRLYLGSILIDAAGGACTAAINRRGVWNLYNKVQRVVETYNSNASWTYDLVTVREYNGGTGQVRGEYVIGLRDNAILLRESDFGFLASGGAGGNLGTTVNSTTAHLLSRWYTQASGYLYRKISYRQPVALGYNYITQVEAANTAGSAFTNNGGQNNTGQVELWM